VREGGNVAEITAALDLVNTEPKLTSSENTTGDTWRNLRHELDRGCTWSPWPPHKALNRPGSGEGSDSTKGWGYASTEEVSERAA
jgi:hypothetical protein